MILPQLYRHSEILHDILTRLSYVDIHHKDVMRVGHVADEVHRVQVCRIVCIVAELY
jgi:hypothetical protein